MTVKKANEVRARLAAAEIIAGLNIDAPDQIDVVRIAAARNAYVIYESLEGAEARIVGMDDRATILVKSRPRMPKSRERFTIAHELGHWELHKEIRQYDVFTEADFHYYTSDPEEIEANVFASELLMPRSLLQPRLNALLGPRRPDCEALKTIADEYQTSFEATAIRLVEESRDCALVVSVNAVVKWFRTAPSTSFYLGTEFRVHDKSTVYDTDRTNPTDFREVPPDAWCRGRCDGIEISEQSFRPSPSRPAVLTFLHVNQADD